VQIRVLSCTRCGAGIAMYQAQPRNEAIQNALTPTSGTYTGLLE
jgi:hypothetical protein